MVEDDIFRLLAAGPVPAPIQSLAPERSYYITSLSKTLAPGLRVGIHRRPAQMQPRIWRVQQMITGARVAGVRAEMARHWIGDGSAERILKEIRNELSMRRLIALNVLGHRKPTLRRGIDVSVAVDSRAVETR